MSKIPPSLGNDMTHGHLGRSLTLWSLALEAKVLRHLIYVYSIELSYELFYKTYRTLIKNSQKKCLVQERGPSPEQNQPSLKQTSETERFRLLFPCIPSKQYTDYLAT